MIETLPRIVSEPLLETVKQEKRSSTTIKVVKQALLTWGPRAIFAAVGGYYGLGWFYMQGHKDVIDRAILRVVYSNVGYAGVGAALSTVQTYSAWGIRLAAAVAAGAGYDLTVRVARLAFAFLGKEEPGRRNGLSSVHSHPADLTRLKSCNKTPCPVK